MKNKVSVVFLGSSKYSVIDEEALFKTFGLSLVVTLPDQPDKKIHLPMPNQVKKFALDNKIPVITTDKLTADSIEQIKQYQPDFLVVADFGLILPEKLLALPHKAAINVHHSLLPKYRGPAPVPFAILAGEKRVGVTIILMTHAVDAGDILAQKTYEMSDEDTTDTVLTKLNQLGGALVVKVIQDFDTYDKNRKKQHESQATYSHYMQRSDGFIDIANLPSPENLDRMVRAYYPWPGVWFVTSVKGEAVRVKLLPNPRHSEHSEESKFLIQVEGKKPMSFKDFMNGYPEGKKLLEKLQLI